MDLLTVIKSLADSEQMQAITEQLNQQQQQIVQLQHQVVSLSRSPLSLWLPFFLMILVLGLLVVWQSIEIERLKKRLAKLVPLIEKSAGVTIIG